jgi:hypothetical protein
MSANQTTMSDPDWIPSTEGEFIHLDEPKPNFMYTLEVLRDNDKSFKLLYEKQNGIRREIYCSPNWEWFDNEQTMIVVYDTENKGKRTLYVDKILNFERISENTENETHIPSLLQFLQGCQENQVPFVLDYLKKDGTRRNIYCSEWNWLKPNTHISVHDVENKGRRTLLIKSILDWDAPEEETEDEEEYKNLYYRDRMVFVRMKMRK